MLRFVCGADVPATPSRVGPARDVGPAVFELSPRGGRLVWLKRRRFNPFFGLAELSWVLAGSDKVAPLTFYLPRMQEFSDDGITLHGAYGYRLRHRFARDQLSDAVDELSRDPYSRRVVLTLWSTEDLGRATRDVPCNTAVYLRVRDRRLDIMICNRSNDLYLGVPYNILTFAGLHAYVAGRLGLDIGWQRHITDSLHLYEHDFARAQAVVAHNSEEMIAQAVSEVPRWDLAGYAQLDHERLTLLYDEVVNGGHDGLAVRNSFIAWKRGDHEAAVRGLPFTDAGVSALEWYRESRTFRDAWLPAWRLVRKSLG